MKAPSARPAETADSAALPAATGTRPFPGKKPTDPSEHPLDPPLTPAPAPGTPMPAATTPTPAVPVEPKTAERPERPVAPQPPSKATAEVLEDQGKRDRQADAAQARKIEDKDDAKRLIMTILGAAVAGKIANQPRNQPPPTDRSRQGYRPPVEEAGRTQLDRQRNVGSMVQRFQGRSPPPAPPGTNPRDASNPAFTQGQRAPRFYDGNRRVVRYASVQEIPPVLVASQQLNRVQVLPQAQSTYSVRPPAPQAGLYYNDIPPTYTAANAYAVSYRVDPHSAISRDDILFRQGSADFADAYSYDLVIDVAEAMNAPTLRTETFVIEGHASAEGDYGKNLLLSQERAERISRELVRHGVSPERLMPVGYGEAEAAHPATAGERDRSRDRRVMVFRMR
ncbi:MAG: OmpA family protein [Prosthecobacter sp.]|uniref:OmpA family protein n=1 Tax=Prosthecobacter sp. TaxID=1965333 RepID=UPI0039025BE6